ncbi:MAG: SDR family oxidoreductase [Candidatus Lambdaproteobacteria bacterium]|nr:SDR family oxidoreductase [Candidatus Lambdaproteobacteria bacterium]
MAQKDTEFHDKRVVLAGGMGGIGGALAERFAALGARLVIIYLSEASIYSFREDHPRAARVAYFVRLHGLTPERMASDLAPAIRAQGDPNLFINVVGELMEEAAAGRSAPERLAGNYQAALELGACAVTCMETAGGHIVAVGHESAQTGGAPADMLQRMLSAHTAALALSALSHRINVNAVLPGLIDTPRNRMQFADRPQSAWVQLDDVLHVVQFLCSEGARAITGQTLSLSGWA